MTDSRAHVRGGYGGTSEARIAQSEYLMDFADAGNTLIFRGYATVFNAKYPIVDRLGEFQESFAPGSFSRSLAKGADVAFLVNHGGLTLARTGSGTLRLSEDAHGLHTEARLDARSQQVQEIRIGVERGDLSEMSLAFCVDKQEWSDDYTDRRILAANIHQGDVSLVNFGANAATAGSVSVGTRNKFGSSGRLVVPAPSGALLRAKIGLARARAGTLAGTPSQARWADLEALKARIEELRRKGKGKKKPKGKVNPGQKAPPGSPYERHLSTHDDPADFPGCAWCHPPKSK
jgi:HK97 family phage prohead protease